MSIDVSQTLKDTENALRDFITFILDSQLGSGWEERSGVSSERIAKWRERKATENRRQRTGAVDERLIYYADFYDLGTILRKNWEYFSTAFDDLKTMEVWLAELERIRDPDAHRRELLPHQRDLVRGIAGEIRTRIARFRSTLETSDAYYPRIEFAADNIGNSWRPGEIGYIQTGLRLRPGDILEYVVTATDPLDEPIEYMGTLSSGAPELNGQWQESGSFRIVISDSHVGKLVHATLAIRSRRKYHASGNWDDSVTLTYEVLPPRA